MKQPESRVFNADIARSGADQVARPRTFRLNLCPNGVTAPADKEIPGCRPTVRTCEINFLASKREAATLGGRKLYCSILVPVDLEEPSSSSKAVPTALALARCFKARLTLTTVVEDKVAAVEAQWSAIGYRELLSRAQARLGTLADELRGETPVEIRIGTGSIGGGILALAEQVGADLIVLASHRPAMRDWLIGANASRVVRHARCSVLVVRE